ncbi:MAG: hypothetical protein RIQ82_364 [Bacteroidota bacterium]|jgi:polyhydroxybutyrate depolymerase
MTTNAKLNGIIKGVMITPLLFLVFSCELDNKNPDAQCGDNQGAMILNHNGLNREYLIHVPENYDNSVPAPIVFNLHGYGGYAMDHLAYADMRILSDQEGFILIYPQGSCLEGSPHWNSFLSGPDNKSDAEDIDFFSSLIDEISSNYNVDLERVYVCGYSNGGMMSYALACALSDRIAAIGSISGNMLDWPEVCAPTHPIPVIIFHGTNDEVLPYQGNSEWSSIPYAVNYWAEFNELGQTPSQTQTFSSGTRLVEYETYGPGLNEVSLDLYRVIQGEHYWFDQGTLGFSLNQTLWDFFDRYDINGLR